MSCPSAPSLPHYEALDDTPTSPAPVRRYYLSYIFHKFGSGCLSKVFFGFCKYCVLLTLPILLFLGSMGTFENHYTLAIVLSVVGLVFCRVVFHFVAPKVGSVIDYAQHFFGVYGSVLYIYTGCFLGFCFYNLEQTGEDCFNLSKAEALLCFAGILMLPVVEIVLLQVRMFLFPFVLGFQVVFLSPNRTRDRMVFGLTLLWFYIGETIVITAFVFSLLNSHVILSGIASLFAGMIGSLLLYLYSTTQYFSDPKLMFELPCFAAKQPDPRFYSAAPFPVLIVVFYNLLFLFLAVVPTGFGIKAAFHLDLALSIVFSVLLIYCPALIFLIGRAIRKCFSNISEDYAAFVEEKSASDIKTKKKEVLQNSHV